MTGLKINKKKNNTKDKIIDSYVFSNVDKGLIYLPNLIRIIYHLYPVIVDTTHFCVFINLLFFSNYASPPISISSLICSCIQLPIQQILPKPFLGNHIKT